MKNNKRRTGEIWVVKYPKRESKFPESLSFFPAHESESEYKIKIIDSDVITFSEGEFSYKGKILESSIPSTNDEIYLGRFFYIPGATYEQIQ